MIDGVNMTAKTMMAVTGFLIVFLLPFSLRTLGDERYNRRVEIGHHTPVAVTSFKNSDGEPPPACLGHRGSCDTPQGSGD